MAKFKFSDFNMGFSYESTASKKAKKVSKLDPLRSSLRVLVSKANIAISRLKKAGVLEQSRAYQEAMRSASSNATALFSVDDKHRFRELKREAARLQAFLSDSEIEPHIVSYNAEANKAIDKHNISFSNQKEAFAATGFRFNVEDEERMKFALRIFRDIASTETAAIGKDAYGSDNLINLIYDTLEGYDPDDSSKKINRLSEKAHNVAYMAVEEYKLNTRWGFVPESSNDSYNSDLNIVEEIKKAQTADEFFESHPMFRKDW